jgi:transcriptional regulator with XRE-family HTH domain
MSVTQKVREYLEENKLTQTEVARMINMPYATFNAMMNGNRNMYPEELRALCIALKVPPEVFMETE